MRSAQPARLHAIGILRTLGQNHQHVDAAVGMPKIQIDAIGRLYVSDEISLKVLGKTLNPELRPLMLCSALGGSAHRPDLGSYRRAYLIDNQVSSIIAGLCAFTEEALVADKVSAQLIIILNSINIPVISLDAGHPAATMVAADQNRIGEFEMLTMESLIPKPEVTILQQSL